MNDLISRKALLAEYDRVHIGIPGRARKLIENAPKVDAAELPIWATERAYKNGYEQGYKDATDNKVGDKLTPTGCEYCLEDSDGYRRGFGAFSLHNPFHANEWEISTGHCKPRKIYFCPMCGRKLAEPPKGE